MKPSSIRLDLQELDRRDVPSVVPITVDKPDEYQTASVEYQQAFDGVVTSTLAQVSPDDAASTDGAGPLGLESATVPVSTTTPADPPPPKAPPTAPPPAPVPNAPPGSKREYTAAEVAELKALFQLQNDLKDRIAGLQNSRKSWQDLIGTQTTTLTALKTQLVTAQTTLQSANAALQKFDQDFQTNPLDLAKSIAPKTIAQVRQELVSKLDEAKGFVKGIETSIATVQGLINNLQQRVDYLNAWISYYNDQITAISSRIAEIGLAAFNGQATGAGPTFAPFPFPALAPGYQDWTKPMTPDMGKTPTQLLVPSVTPQPIPPAGTSPTSTTAPETTEPTPAPTTTLTSTNEELVDPLAPIVIP